MQALQAMSGPYRTTDPPEAGLLSLNICHQQRKGVRLCKGNCRSIEVTILYPVSPIIIASSTASNSPILNLDLNFAKVENRELQKTTEPSSPVAPEPRSGRPAAAMPADHQEQLVFSLMARSRDDGHAPPPTSTTKTQPFFPFMNLPLELRLKIYGFLLPARTHTIVTQVPYSGFFYNTSNVPEHSAQSFYPFGTTSPTTNKLTTYKILSTNFRASFPEPSIYPEILRVSKQVKREAEPVLYASSSAVFDFGIHLEALMAFWGDRSEIARKGVKNIKIAWEIPCLENTVAGGGEASVVDERWVKMCAYLQSKLTGLRNLDLTVWSSSGSASGFPTSVSIPDSSSAGLGEGEDAVAEEEVRRWREWEYTSQLLTMEALRRAKVTWWGFQTVGGQDGEVAFDSWLAGRMVGDNLVKDRMIRDGVVVEGVVVLQGVCA